LSPIFNQLNHSRATWCTFLLACAINILYLCFFNYRGYDDNNTDIDASVEIVITALSIMQLVIACFTLVLSLVVRSPVVFAAQFEEVCEAFEKKLQQRASSVTSSGANDSSVNPPTNIKAHVNGLSVLGYVWYACVSGPHVQAIIYTALEPMTIYYMGYVCFAALGLTYNNFFNCLLLLDLIVKNATCKNVLMAAYLPREALMMAAILGVFCMYIFAFFTVRLKPSQFDVRMLCRHLY
jgi:hypothetical protein